jgi:DNA polymerase-3 subunit epsilon
VSPPERIARPIAESIVFVDLETTGATGTSDRITEIGIIEVDAAGAREWSTLVNPETRISSFIERLTGISNAMVAQAPTFAEIAAEVLERLQGRLFVAHNARFDYGFLKSEFRRAGHDFRATVLCTVKLSRRLFPQHHRHNLDALIERHGLDVSQRHRALGDARLIHQFWRQAEEGVAAEEFEAALAALLARPSLPEHLDAAIIEDLPEGPGVYLFYGENQLPLYVGKSKDIRKRVLSHFAADHASSKEMALAQQVRRIDWIETAGDIGAQLLEADMIKKLQPIHNRRLRRNEELCAWRLDEIDHGGKPQLVFAAEADFGSAGPLYGPFKSAREAQTALRDIADAHGLCHALLGLEKVAPGRPCFSHQLHNCRGACVGGETATAHQARLLAALGRLRMTDWPFAGPAMLREGEEAHLVDRWCYLGTARSEGEVRDIVESAQPRFDRDTYRLLHKAVGKMKPVLATSPRRAPRAGGPAST